MPILFGFIYTLEKFACCLHILGVYSSSFPSLQINWWSLFFHCSMIWWGIGIILPYTSCGVTMGLVGSSNMSSVLQELQRAEVRMLRTAVIADCRDSWTYAQFCRILFLLKLSWFNFFVCYSPNKYQSEVNGNELTNWPNRIASGNLLRIQSSSFVCLWNSICHKWHIENLWELNMIESNLSELKIMIFRKEWNKTNREHIIKVKKILIINLCALCRRHSVNKNKGYPNKFEFQINEE